MSWDKEIDEMHSRQALAFEMGGADCQSTRVEITEPWMGAEPSD